MPGCPADKTSFEVLTVLMTAQEWTRSARERDANADDALPFLAI